MSNSTQFTQSYNANNDWYCFTHLENSSNNLQYSGIGSNITGIQSESYLNTTNIEISETTSEFSVSNPSSDLYYLDSLEIISADVTVSNFTQIIENNTEIIAGNITDVEFIQFAFSFIAPSNSYLDMFQLYFYAPTETATIDFYLAKASYDLSQERINIDPVQSSYIHLKQLIIDPESYYEWYSIDVPNTFLNNSNTYNNTWFIEIMLNGGDTKIPFIRDSGTLFTDLNDETTVVYYDFMGDSWNLFLNSGYNTDLFTTVSFTDQESFIEPTTTVVIDDSIDKLNDKIEISSFTPLFISFEANDGTIVDKISFYNTNTYLNGYVGLKIYPSIWDYENHISIVSNFNLNIYDLILNNSILTEEWVTYDIIDYYINNTLTNNNTWFIGMQYIFINGMGAVNLGATTDSIGISDLNDEQIVYYYDLFDEKFYMYLNSSNSDTIDIFTKILFKNKNSTIQLLEDDITQIYGNVTITGVTKRSQSFYLSENRYLTSISIYGRSRTVDTWSSIQLYYSSTTWNSTNNISVPSLTTFTTTNYLGTYYVEYNSEYFWKTFTLSSPLYLDNTLTENNTWNFILAYNNGTTEWAYNPHGLMGDNVNETICMNYDSSLIGWEIAKYYSTYTFDYVSKLSFNKINNFNTLKFNINNTQIQSQNETGIWNISENIQSHPSGFTLSVTSDWDLFKFQIISINASFIKSFVENSSYIYNSLTSTINWNITSNIESFDSEFDTFNLKYFVPLDWINYSISSDLLETELYSFETFNSTYNQLIISNPQNTTYYFVFISDSTDFIIDSKINGESVTIAYANETLTVVNTFDYNTSGFLNLTISNSSNYIFVTQQIEISNDNETTFEPWIISQNIMSSYGDFVIQVFFANETAFGYEELNLTIYGRSNISIYSTNFVYFGSNLSYYMQYFEIQNNNELSLVDVNSINCSIDSEYYNLISHNNGTIGEYTIEIDSRIFEIGVHNISIIVLKDNFDMIQYSTSFIIFGNTTLNELSTLNNTVLIDPISIDLELNYSLSFNQNGIENASFECNVDSTHIFDFDNSSLYVQSNGLYQFNLSIFELTIGFHNVSVTFNNTYYESQTILIEFEINFNTELIIDTNIANLTQIPFGYSEIFVISIEFKTINDEGISNANITYDINNTIGSIEIIDYENGTYQLELDISDFESDLYIISIFASKQFYISQNDTLICTILEEIIPEPEPEPEPPIPPYVIPLIVIGIMGIIAGIVYFLKNRLVFKKLPINI